MKRALLSLALLAGLAAVAAAVALSVSAFAVEQPLAFNHRVHVEDVGAECTDCHLYAHTGVRATIPNWRLCADCHAEPLGESAEEARLVEYIEATDPIPWRKVYWVPDHVYFSHRRHTAIAGIECETCHRNVGEQSKPLTRPLRRVSMDDCMDCHGEGGVSNDCVACHR